MSGSTYFDLLYQSYAHERDSRHQRYMLNARAVCSRSGGYRRYKRDGDKYFKGRHARTSRQFSRTFLRLYNLWPQGITWVITSKGLEVRDDSGC